MAAVIPMHTPDEAISALEHAKLLGANVGMIASHVHRPLPGMPSLADDDGFNDVRVTEWETRGWIDTFGLDSPYDYDPVWAKAIELKMTLAAHTAGMGATDRASISNFIFNQAGHFAAAGAALAKSLFLGGVLARFPELRLAILEGGAAPGVETFITLAGNYPKRGGAAIQALNPKNLDAERVRQILVEADPRLAKFSAEQLAGTHAGMTRPRDDYEAAQVSSVEDIRDQFCTGFAWGCEADDPLVGLALTGASIHWEPPFRRSSLRTSGIGTFPISMSPSRRPTSSSSEESWISTSSVHSSSRIQCGSTVH